MHALYGLQSGGRRGKGKMENRSSAAATAAKEVPFCAAVPC
jgi:hypothetical protein